MLRPRIKYEHRPYRIGDGRIRIGGGVYGIAAELADPGGRIWTLLTLMDGTRTTDAITAELVVRHPGVPRDDARQALERLIASGYVEDAAQRDPGELPERAKERYGRARGLYAWMDLTPRETTWDAQLRLSRAKVVVVGLGGSGTSAALALAGSGVGHLHCVDFDEVELSNLNRQVLYAESDVGRPKVEAAVSRLRAVNSDITVTGEHLRITRTGVLTTLIEPYDLLVLTADQPAELRVWANRSAIETDTAWVSGGYQGPQASACVFVPGTGPCFECFQAAEKNSWEARGAAVEELPFGARPAAVNAVSAGMSGLLVAHLAISLITGVPGLAANRAYATSIFSLDNSFVVDPGAPRPGCPACGFAERPLLASA
ncbi:ThiF family adenylyltransferase [Nonomuraea mesophila]|uniref:ThiF family adenylyltransferase n=1 Tax=Nonomuraea mesophila TaxID=2530382 RepID=A0A4R5FXP4_9ACTN|nr:ThiF family adenylyltransferase [Nonomuraea mesophila]TDE60310.1 ThiF family adenylyltransferase [Nonomuraea mesophila]